MKDMKDMKDMKKGMRQMTHTLIAYYYIIFRKTRSYAATAFFF